MMGAAHIRWVFRTGPSAPLLALERTKRSTDLARAESNASIITHDEACKDQLDWIFDKELTGVSTALLSKVDECCRGHPYPFGYPMQA
jgi:hypothetical protein